MRLLHVHDFFAPGNSRFGFDTARKLAARGHEIHVMAAVGPQGPADGAVVEGVTFHTYPHRPELGTWARLSYARRENRSRFEALHAAHRFELLVLNQPLCATSVLRSPAARSLPVAYWFLSPWAVEWRIENRGAGALKSWIQAGLRNRMEGQALRAAGGVLVASEFMRGQVKAQHPEIDDARIRVLPGAVDPERFRPDGPREEARARPGLGRGFAVATVRRHVERMGIDLLVRAVAQLPGVELWVGGDGPLRRDLEALAGSLGAKARFLGSVADEALPDLYRAADLVVLPTRELEGFGLVAIEAMACGTPAMGTPVAAIPEVLGPLGLLFRDASVEGIRDGIRDFLAKPPSGLGERCRASVVERYAWPGYVERVEAAYGKVLREGPGHGRG